MAYHLAKLAAGSYDVILDGVIIAGVVRSPLPERVTWTAELLIDLAPADRPAP